MSDWYDPVFLIWLINVAATFALGNAYGQDKERLRRKRQDSAVEVTQSYDADASVT